MKRIITLIFLLAVIGIASETNAQVLLQKKHHQQVLSNSAKKSKRPNKTFNALTKQLPTKIENHSWDSLSSSWLKEFESVVSYNSNNLPTQELMYDLAGNEVFRSTSTYDSKNRLVEYLTEYKSNNNWIGNEKYTYVYDVNDYLIETEEYYYSGIAWEIMYGNRKIFDFDVVNNTSSIITLENYGMGYDTIDQYIYYYDQIVYC